MEEMKLDVSGKDTGPADFGYDAPRRCPDPNVGLSASEARQRMDAGYGNTPVDSPTKTIGQIILGNLLTYFNLIFTVIAVALIIVGSSWANLTFLVAVICNTLIGTVQEIRSKRTLDRLTLLHAPSARAIRDGHEVSLAVDELVLDDIAVFEAGDQITADGRVVWGEIQVNEALITGESDEITKHVGDTVRSGSYVVSGECRVYLTAVGPDSFVSKLTLEAKKGKKQKTSGMTRSLNMLIAVIGIAMIPIGFGLMTRNLWGTDYSVTAWRAAVESTSAALVGMIPEGLYLLVSVALAVSVIRLARKNTLCHDLSCIETLARVDTLCVDKTGTITTGEMRVTDLLVIPAARVTRDQAADILGDMVSNVKGGNDTMNAIKEAYASRGKRYADSVVPFTSTTKYTGVSFGNEHYVLGAPEFLLRERFANFESAISPFTKNGSRVLLLGSVPSLPGGPLQERVTPIAFVLLDNPIRPQAADTFAYFTRQGVAIKVISGDSPATASAAAEKAGIPDAERYIDATSLDSYEKTAQACEQYTVFGRVTPEQKRWLIRALKAAGHTVAMTGDGINDVLALKEADCSIAMASGSDVASQVSQLVLLDNDFSHMPSVVAEGRRVINNIERSASLFLVKNIFSFFLSIITIIAGVTYPLAPVHLTLINIFTIGIPSFFLALEPNENVIRGKFLRSVLYRAAPAGFTNVFLAVFIIMYRELFDLHFDQVGTICAIVVGFVGIMMLFIVCRPFNRMRAALWIALTIGLAASCTLLSLFSQNVILSRLTGQSLLILITFLVMAYPVMRTFLNIMSWADEMRQRLIRYIKRTAEKL